MPRKTQAQIEGARGGKKRMASLTSSERSALARKAARARWAKRRAVETVRKALAARKKKREGRMHNG